MGSQKIVIVTVSDTCSNGENVDSSGPYLKEAVQKYFQLAHVEYVLIPDDISVIRETLVHYSDDCEAELILTTGGTGFTVADVTPEATRSVIDKEAPGISTAMCVKSLEITPMAMLSRSVCGIRGKTLIINFPGSLKAVKECFDIVHKVIPHALEQIQGRSSQIKATHALVQEGSKITEKFVCPHKNLNSKVNVSQIAYRQRESSFPMIEVSVALHMIIEILRKAHVRRACDSDLMSCLGYVLARDEKALEPFPPFPASVKDGYACLHADGAGCRRVWEAGVIAGDFPLQELKSGECVRINTGAPLPLGADCVVQVEDTKLLKHSSDGLIEEEIQVMVAPSKGQDIRPIGSDIAQYEVVLKNETLIGPAEIGILATIGVTKLSVYTKAKVAILSTGNELQSPYNEVFKPGHIRDSNKLMLTHLLQDYAECKDFGIARDNPSDMKAALEQALSWCDILVTTGSVSMGERDLLKPILKEDFGAQIVFGRLNMKPGKPTTFAICSYKGKIKYVFALPGNPVSALVTSHLLVIPALRFWMGNSRYENSKMNVVLDRDVSLDVRPEYARAIYKFSEKYPIAELTGNQISSRLCSTRNASLLVELPSSKVTENLKKGAVVVAQIIGKI